jgi:regulator of protease activity HflC (stomatin/prohibitin superfamily)
MLESDDYIKTRPNKREVTFNPWNGCLILFLNLLMLFGSLAIMIIPPIVHDSNIWTIGIGIPLFISTCFIWGGFFINSPGKAIVLILMGKYKGTVKEPGYYWCNPFMTFQAVNLRSNNLVSPTIKVNDKNGSPILIAAVVVWKIQDTYKSTFEVADVYAFVQLQSEVAIRTLAVSYPYDKTNEMEISLRCGHEQVIAHLKRELQERLEKSGVEVEDTRISHLAYSSEIASAMLKRQQAEAVIAAREKIVQGAVSIVGHAIETLKQNNITNFQEDERAKFVSNLLLVLCSDTQVHPVINTN